MHILFHVYKFINNNSNSSRIRILELELYTMNVHLGTHRSQLLGSCAAVLQCRDVVLVVTGLIYFISLVSSYIELIGTVVF